MDLVKIAEAILEAQGETASIFDGPSTATVDGYTLLDIGVFMRGCVLRALSRGVHPPFPFGG